jgi:hypothetical protein
MPGLFSWRRGDPPSYIRLIHQHVCEPIIAAFPDNTAPVNFGTAVKALRQAFSTGNGAAAFDGLIKAAVGGDNDAVAWLNCLTQDSRFQFERCFPGITHNEGKWSPSAPAPADDDKYIQWDYDDHISSHKLIRVTYALNAAASIAVFSKGRRTEFRELSTADAVSHWCKQVGDENILRGNELVRATERHWAFHDPLDATVHLAADLLDQIGEAGNVGKTKNGTDRDYKIRDDGYQALKAWLHAVGGDVTPDKWSAQEGGEPTAEDQDTLRLAFSVSVPMGRTIVEEFGVRAFDCERRFKGALSAGPPFAGYEEIDTISRRYWAEHSSWGVLAEMWSSVPALSDKNKLAGVLHQIYQQIAFVDETVETSAWHVAAKQGLVFILEEVCGWEPFPQTDEAELGHGSAQLAIEKVRFLNNRPVSRGTVRVLKKGFCDRRGQMLEEAVVERK